MARGYYLYAEKKTKTLNELRVSVLPLAFVPTPGSVTVTYAGYAYSTFYIKGNELHFVHRDPREWTAFYQARATNEVFKAWMNAGYLGQPEEVVAVTYSYLTWDTTTTTFTSTTITESLTLAEDETETYYQLLQPFPSTDLMIGSSSDYTAVSTRQGYGPRYGPSVITDDEVEYTDWRGYANEYTIDQLTGELSFHPAENLLVNPAFEIVETSSNALHWKKVNSSGSPLATLTSSNVGRTAKAAYGDRVISLEPANTIYQEVKLRDTQPHHLSFHAQVPGSDSQVQLIVNPIDINGYYRDKDNTQLGASFDVNTAVFTHTFDVSSNVCGRYHAIVGASDSYFSGEGKVLGNLPSSVHKIEFRLKGASANLYATMIDGTQIHSGPEKAPFLGLLPKTTIEYEDDPDGLFEPDPSSNVFRLNDVNINPLTSAKPDGFLSLYEVGSVDDWQLGKGSDALAFSSTTNIASFGRFHLPYARYTGIGKLHERQNFHKEGWDIDDDLATTFSVVLPSDTQELAPENSYTDTEGFLHFYTNPSSNTSQRTTIHPLFYDQFGNPVSSSNVTVTQTSAGATKRSVVVTDEVGRAKYIHTPFPGTTAGRSKETITFQAGNTIATYKVDIV